MSPNTATKNAKTEWIPGTKPRFEKLRLTVSNGRAFLGAKGWSRELGENHLVQLELDAIGLQNLATSAQRALAELIDQKAAGPAVLPLACATEATATPAVTA